jgi:hypothetical protein
MDQIGHGWWRCSAGMSLIKFISEVADVSRKNAGPLELTSGCKQKANRECVEQVVIIRQEIRAFFSVIAFNVHADFSFFSSDESLEFVLRRVIQLGRKNGGSSFRLNISLGPENTAIKKELGTGGGTLLRCQLSSGAVLTQTSIIVLKNP